jgi:hypothetical protein
VEDDEQDNDDEEEDGEKREKMSGGALYGPLDIHFTILTLNCF